MINQGEFAEIVALAQYGHINDSAILELFDNFDILWFGLLLFFQLVYIAILKIDSWFDAKLLITYAWLDEIHPIGLVTLHNDHLTIEETFGFQGIA